MNRKVGITNIIMVLFLVVYLYVKYIIWIKFFFQVSTGENQKEFIYILGEKKLTRRKTSSSTGKKNFRDTRF